MADFDVQRALREEISSLAEIRTTLLRRERELEQRYAEIEVEINAIKKLRGFADAELDRKRDVLKGLAT